MIRSRLRWTVPVVALLLTSCATASEAEPDPPMPHPADISAEIADLEAQYGAVVGVYALDTATGQEIAYRADDRFAYASTIKALAAAAVLHRPDTYLDELLTYTADDLVPHSPVTERHVDTGMTLGEVVDAAIRESDNTAGNLLFQRLGGPEGLRAALRDIGDDTTTPTRWEPDLNGFEPGDDRDTSTAAALATSLLRYATEVLDEEDRTTLITAMLGVRTGDGTIRAGVSAGWQVADKTGTGDHGTRNDIALLWSDEGADPVVLAVLTRSVDPDGEPSDSLVAESTAIAMAALKG
ncbi:beta-lactamase class A [Stackebrandtia endophytica]|uniref:Beta-lactamase n=1 Tax=Stackebrandtia endophytica TaxID=1496996 RepID=A0A543AW05_9ACTN|nr:class A beta-lactamase [Stackebrandtia endophytica]TQL76731.1 beta-lactamase class A [Stackebrandtia endophytica]